MRQRFAAPEAQELLLQFGKVAAGRRLARFAEPGTMPGRVLISGGDGFAEDWAGGGRWLVEPGDMKLALVQSPLVPPLVVVAA